ncbi:hypothetical protein DAPPUDRAFT_245838 [Daphnia pulex]|uniref:Uncharacterized protein n=1 Tax=Daphnia pulex TaxID=6669 RepID=E9GP52_DAPPU|nr:hypothetical protein DAPPUDRAFT_245838 [Daphnia pulex]|eukprot:EFX78740.1 hypothetical protein DAPPUDRAFT_245838 [Daphnia pulex]
MEIEIKQRMQDILDKLEVVEDKIKIPSRQLTQLEEELNSTVEDENSSEESSGSEIEMIDLAGDDGGESGNESGVDPRYGEVLNAPAWCWESWRGVEVYSVVLKAIQWSRETISAVTIPDRS